MKISKLLALAGCLAATCSLAPAQTIFDSIGASQDGDSIVGDDPSSWWYQSFSTGSSPAVLDTVAFVLLGVSGGTTTVSLYSDSGQPAPATLLATLGTIDNTTVSTTSYETYSVSPATPISLSASTRYWVELSADVPDALFWAYTNDNNYDDTGGEYYTTAGPGSPADNVVPGSPFLMAVNPVPEPSTLALGLLGGAGALWKLRRRK